MLKSVQLVVWPVAQRVLWLATTGFSSALSAGAEKRRKRDAAGTGGSTLPLLPRPAAARARRLEALHEEDADLGQHALVGDARGRPHPPQLGADVGVALRRRPLAVAPPQALQQLLRHARAREGLSEVVGGL
jgi:hypothetical protein